MKTNHALSPLQLILFNRLAPVIVAFAVVAGCASREERIQGLIARLYVKPVGAGFDIKDGVKAATSLKNIGTPAVPYLLNELKPTSIYLREKSPMGDYTYRTCVFIEFASGVLGEVKRDAPNTAETSAVVNALLDTYRRAGEEGRAHCFYPTCKALAQIGSSSVEPLVALLDDPDMVKYSINVLGRIGAPAQTALPRLQSMLQTTLDKPTSETIRWGIDQLSETRTTGGP